MKFPSLTAFVVGMLVVADVPAQAQEKVPLSLTLPKPLFVGTPVPIKVPNLEKASAARQPDFLAPAGTVNLAKGKTVTASDEFPVIGEAAFVTDGDKTGTDGSFVEFGPMLQWVQIDLGAAAKIYAVVIWHFHAQARVYHDVVVQVSDDPAFKSGVKMIFNNDHDDTAKLGAGKDLAYIETYEGKLIDAKGVTGRYVRLYSNANTTDELNHYVEVEIYGQK